MAKYSQDRPPPYNYTTPEAAYIYPSMESVGSNTHSFMDQDISMMEISDEVRATDNESQIQIVKSNFESLRAMLDQKEECILESLDNKISQSDPESENLIKQRENLLKTRQNLEESMKNPELSSILADAYSKVTSQIELVDKQVNARKYLVWNISECEKSIENVCSVCEAQNILGVHRGKKDVLWEKVQPGSERTQVLQPVGLAIEPQTDRIYIADAGNKRIQVFNCDGEHISHIPVKSGTQMLFIWFIGRFLFLIENRDNELWILKMNPNSGKCIFKSITNRLTDFYTTKHQSPKFLLDLKRNDTSIITLCIYQNNHKILTHRYTIDNLNIVNSSESSKPIELHSPHIKDFTTALAVKIVGTSYKLTQFYILYKNTSSCVQIFNWDGQVVKAIIQLNLTAGVSSFLIDDENNIIICNVENISDTNKPEVGIQNLYTNYIYSNDGSRQHKWVYKSEVRGGFIQSILKPFNKKPAAVSSRTMVYDVTRNTFFSMCINSRQNIFLLHNQETSYMLRAF